jgi:hypothetical protein
MAHQLRWARLERDQRVSLGPKNYYTKTQRRKGFAKKNKRPWQNDFGQNDYRNFFLSFIFPSSGCCCGGNTGRKLKIEKYSLSLQTILFKSVGGFHPLRIKDLEFFPGFRWIKCRRSHYFPIFCSHSFHSFTPERKGHAPTAEVAFT